MASVEERAAMVQAIHRAFPGDASLENFQHRIALLATLNRITSRYFASKVIEDPYVQQLARSLDIHQQSGHGHAIPLGDMWRELLGAATSLDFDVDNAELFIELDRNVISDLQDGSKDPTDLLPYLFAAAVRKDQYGDVIITITDGDRFRF